MAKRKENHYNNNVIIDNKVVSVSDLQTNAKSASMRFLVLVLGITLLASMVVPYLSMAAAATSTSNAFNGAVIPGYSMGGLELTAYGIDLNSWGQSKKPCFVRSNYGIWNEDNTPENYMDVANQYIEDTSDIAAESQASSDRLMNTSDKSSGWEQLTGRTNYTNNNPDGSTSVAQNQKVDDITPIRTVSDYNYWNSKIPVSNSSNDANITVSLVPDFVVVSKNEQGKACIVQSPDNVGTKSIVQFSTDAANMKYSEAKPIYVPLKALMDKYKSAMGDGVHTFNDLFKAVANDSGPLNTLLDDASADLLNNTAYYNLNSNGARVSTTNQAFNPYPYTMVFSTQDSVSNQTVTSSIYENCEAYVYFSPTVVYQKYLQVKNEYNSIVNSASSNLSSDAPDAVTVLQVGYYAAALSILEAYLEEALPQDATRGYVGMSETNAIRGGASDGSKVGQRSNNFSSGKDSVPSPESFQKVTYATLMWDVASGYSSTAAAQSDCALDETNAIMDSLSVFGYSHNQIATYNAGVMVGMQRQENFDRRTNLTPRVAEDKTTDEYTQKINDKKAALEKEYETTGGVDSSSAVQAEKNYMSSTRRLQEEIDQLTAERNARMIGENSNNAGIYTPVYYPIQQHKMPDNEKTYRFSILANIPYDTVISYISSSGAKFATVELSYSSNFTSSFTSVTDTFDDSGKKQTALKQLVQQYNAGDESTGLDLSSFDISQSIVCSPDSADVTTKTQTGTDQDNATEDTVQDRVDAALLGYASGNMTSDNVHDLVDIMRALPGGKYETFYRFFNPIKSDGDDQDLFVARVTPAVTTYFPSLLVNGYENAGGAEVDQSCTTSNVSFDYFSIPSFAPCFASHTASDTYYGALNYELRAFYKKGFIKTLSSKTNIPQIEEAEDAIHKSDEAVKNLTDSNEISSETMAKNIKTIFVEAKRYAATLVLQNAMKNYGKGSAGMLNMDTVNVFYNEVYKYMFNKNFGQHYIIDIKGNITGNTKKMSVDGHNDVDYTPIANKKFNNWDWKNSISSYDDLANGKDRSFIASGEEQSSAEQGVLNAIYTNAYNDLKDPDETNKTAESTVSDSITQLANETGKKKGKVITAWNNNVKEALATTKHMGKQDEVTDEEMATYQVDDGGNTKNKTNYAKITGIYWQATDGPEKGKMASNGSIFPSADSYLINLDGDGDNKSLGLRSGTSNLWFNTDLKINAVAVKSDNAAYGPVYWQKNSDLIISNDYLTKINSMIISKTGAYYWGDYHEIEKSTASTNESIDVGNLVNGEGNSIYTVGYSSGGGVFKKIAEEATDDDYAKKVKEALDDACKEMFKDLTNVAKDLQLLQQSMPSQMQNCLAWADYQNASDSEAQFQADPQDTIDINLAQKDTNAKDDYDKADVITGIPSLEAAGYHLVNGSVQIDKSVTGATNSAIQARMERGVEGSTWTSSVQPACYTITAIIARIDSMQNSGVSYPYSNICSGRLRSGADQYAILQAHVIDYSSIASGISGDLATRVRGKVVSITNPNYGALPDFLNILGTIGGLIAEATSGFANLTGGMFEDVMWNGNGESATKVATSDNQTGDGTIETKKYDGTGNIERKGSMWVLDSTGGQSFYTLVQSLALVLVLVSLLYIAFKNFYEYTRPAGASVSVGEKDEAGKKSAAAESKILAATQLKVVMPRAIIAVFMIGLPPMSGAGFQGGNFLLLQMLSSIFNQISHVFINLNGQSVMNLWLNTGADLLSDNPGIGEYIAYGAAMFVIGAMFVVGTLAVLLADIMLIFFYIIGPLMWALYVWPYNDTTSKTKNPDGIIAKLTSRMKFAWTGGRVGNKAPEGMIECYCETAMLNVMWSVIFWAITIIFTGVTGTIATDTSSTPGNTATLAGAATVSNAAYAKSALMSTGNYYASASVAHADGLFNAGILPMPAWVRMLIAAALAVVVFMLMIRMASSMFKKSLGNTFAAVSEVGGAIRGGAIGGALGRAAQLAKTGTNVAAMAGNAKNIADRARNAADNFRKASVRGKLHQIGNAGRSLGNHGANALRRAEQAANTAGQYISGDKNLTDGFTNVVRGINNHLNEGASVNQKDNLKRLNGARESINKLQEAIGANDLDRAQAILDTMTPEEKRLAAHYAPSLFERNRGGHDLRLRAGVTNHDFDRARRELDDRIEIAEARADRHVRNSNNALTPAQVRARNLAAAGIDDLSALTNTLLSADTNDRTKRAARRQLNEYSRRAFGEDIDWDQKGGDRKAVNDLLVRDRHVPTADDRAERISDAISDAAATGNKAISSFATRHQIGAYEGDASQVITRELGRTSDALAAALPSVTATASDISGIRTTIDTQLTKIADVYKNRGYTDIEANARALDDLAGQFGSIDADRARFLSSEITNGGEISNGDAIRLELFKQRYNLGESTVGDKIVESGAGFKTARYVNNLSRIPRNYLNSDAQAAIADMNIQQAYEDYVNSYPISSDAYHASYEHMLDNFPAGRERREMRDIMQNSPFNALFASGRDITRNDIDTLIASADRSGHPIDPKAISAMETVYSEVRQQAVENDATFKNNLLASLPADSGYSSADDAINALDGRQIDTNSLTAEVRNSVNDQLTRAQGAFNAATNRISTLTTEIKNTQSQLRHAGKEFKDAKNRGDKGEMTRWNDEVIRLKGQLGMQRTELSTETSNQSAAQTSVSRIQGYLDSITATNLAPNPLSPTGRDEDN